MADRVTLFKLLAKSVGVEHGVTPCFMAKPIHGLPGNSGHIHISLIDLEGKNIFARVTPDSNPPWPDSAGLSETGHHFLAGLLDALPDIMPLLAPTVNSYKRLVENYWAPVHLSWGLEDRKSSIRLIAPPVCKPAATRFEVRIPGADLHPHYALNALLAAGWRGVQKKLPLRIAPLSTLTASDPTPERLPRSLDEAVQRFTAPDSRARDLFDAAFIEYFAQSREHELRLWKEAVTDWYDDGPPFYRFPC
jgi:glutamine synthetase